MDSEEDEGTMADLESAKAYLHSLRERRAKTFGKGIMFVDTGYTLGLHEAANRPIPPSELLLYLHNYKSRPGESDEMRRLDMFEFVTRNATVEDIALLKALINEKLMED